MTRRIIQVFLALMLLVAFSPAILACGYCGFSPTGWGFCQWGAAGGWSSCITVVADPFSGRTTCQVSQRCHSGGTHDPLYPYFSSQSNAGPELTLCEWVDADVDSILLF